jgi:hypothetical protein
VLIAEIVRRITNQLGKESPRITLQTRNELSVFPNGCDAVSEIGQENRNGQPPKWTARRLPKHFRLRVGEGCLGSVNWPVGWVGVRIRGERSSARLRSSRKVAAS